MAVLDVYIRGQKLDMFPDEGIKLIVRTKDVRDISKVYDTFSREFSVPASGRNNTILGRAAQGIITDNPAGVDYRQLQDASLEIGGVQYRLGSIKYIKAIYKNGVMVHHVLNFRGKMLAMKDILGGKYLHDLNLDAYNVTSDAATVYAGMQPLGLLGGLVTYPLGFTKRDYSQTVLNAGIVPPSTVSPALKVNAIFQAVKDDYGIDFSFHPSINVASSIQVHALNEVDEGVTRQGTLRYDTVTGPDADRVNKSSGVINLAGYASGVLLNFTLTVTPTDPAASWSVLSYFGNTEVESLRRTGSGSQSVTVSFNKNTAISNDLVFRMTTTIQTQFDITVDAEYEFNSVVTPMFQAITPTYTFYASGPRMADRLPRIEIIELVKGFMQLWNLIPVVDEIDSNIIVLTPYDVWKEDDAVPIDITRWADISEYSSEVPDIPKSVNFKFQPAVNIGEKYILDEYGDGIYDYIDTNDNASGDPLDVTIPFTPTVLVYSAFKNGDVGHDCLHFYDITFAEEEDTYTFVPNTDKVYVSYAVARDIVSPALPIEFEGFPAPLNQYVTGTVGFSDADAAFLFDGSSLNEVLLNPLNGAYIKFYSKYMEQILARSARLIKATAVLPLSILSQIKASTPLRVGDRVFNINSLETDTLTGETSMELINYQRAISSTEPSQDTVPPTINTLSLVPNAIPSQVTGVIATQVLPDSVSLEWDDATSSSTYIKNYVVYRDTILMATITGNPANSSATITGLTAGSSGLWRVAAQDAEDQFGNFSDPPLLITQPSQLDPTFTEPITQTDVELTSFNINWNEAVVGAAPLQEYRVYVNEALTHTIPAGSPSYVQPLTGLEEYTNYRIVIEVYDTSGYMGSSSQYFFATADDLTPPTDVQNLVVTGNTYNSISLAWDAATDNVGVTGYRIYDGNGAFVQTVGNVLAYTIGALSYNVQYTYKVKAVDARNNESVNFSNTVTQTTTDTVPPSDVVMNAPNSITYNSAVLSWEPATDNVGIAGYNLYDENEVLLEELDNSPGTQLSDLDSLTEYTYKVKAKDVAGNLSVNFTSVTFSTLEYLVPPNVVQLIPSTLSASSVRLFWEVPVPAVGQVEPTAYYVYYSSATDNNNSIKTVFGGGSFTTDITGLAAATEYSFKLKSRADSGEYSEEFSNIQSVTTEYPIYIPTGVSATQIAGTIDVLVDWSDVQNPNLINYVVEKRVGTLGTWTEVGTPSISTFIDTNLDVAEIFYRVKAIYSEGTSEYSLQPSVTIIGLAPGNVTAVQDPQVLQVNLTWTVASNAARISSYNIERSTTSASAGFSLIGTAPLLQYSDDTVQGNVTYWYRVRANYITSTISEYGTSNSIAVTSVQLPAPTGLSGSQDFTTPPNQTLTWNEVAGATGFRVESKLSSDSTWDVLANDLQQFWYRDSFISPTGDHDYRVKALGDTPEEDSPYSEITVTVLKVVEIGKSFSPSSCTGDTNDSAYWRGLETNTVPTDGETIYSDNVTSTVFAGGGATWKISNISRSLFFTAEISNSGIISNITPC